MRWSWWFQKDRRRRTPSGSPTITSPLPAAASNRPRVLPSFRPSQKSLQYFSKRKHVGVGGVLTGEEKVVLCWWGGSNSSAQPTRQSVRSDLALSVVLKSGDDAVHGAEMRGSRAAVYLLGTHCTLWKLNTWLRWISPLCLRQHAGSRGSVFLRHHCRWSPRCWTVAINGNTTPKACYQSLSCLICGVSGTILHFPPIFLPYYVTACNIFSYYPYYHAQIWNRDVVRQQPTGPFFFLLSSQAPFKRRQLKTPHETLMAFLQSWPRHCLFFVCVYVGNFCFYIC